VSFDGAIISDNNFKNTKFDDNVSFMGAEFHEHIRFEETEYSSISLSYAELRNGLSFLKVKGSGELKLNGVTSPKSVDFIQSKLGEKLNLRDVSTGGVYIRRSSVIEVDLSMATISGRVEMSESSILNLISRETRFQHSLFINDLWVEKLEFWKLRINDGHFRKIHCSVGRFEYCTVEKGLLFDNLDLSKYSFKDSNLKNVDFVSPKWAKYSDLINADSKRRKVIENFFNRDYVYNELLVMKIWKSMNFFQRIKNRLKILSKFEEVENVYRALKTNYKEKQNETVASNWHFGEKEMYRRKSLLRFYNPLSFSNLYWASSGYGERPIRAGLILLGVVTFLCLLMNHLGLTVQSASLIPSLDEIKGFSWYFDFTKAKLIVISIFQHVLFVKEPILRPATSSGIFIMLIFSKLIIPIQAALFAFALRNKFRR